jgi:two-component system chemotaxis response regulator CheB
MRIVHDLPRDLPAAVFVAMHVRAGSVSRLAAILDRQGTLPAHPVLGREPIRRGRIYVAAPDTHLVVSNDEVSASRAPRENRHRPSIDVLFRSAALSCGARTIGVILSGTMDDGTAGLRWIKRVGGCTLVQDPSEAQFAGMPTSAIENVTIDRVLPAQQIAAAIVDFVRGAAVKGEAAMDPPVSVDDQGAPRDKPNGPPSAFICPDCGGTLFDVGDDETLRFRCRVGHAYSGEALNGEQERNLEEALWAAVRTLEEHADLAKRLETRARRSQLVAAAARFAASARDALDKAAVVRRALPAGSEPLAKEAAEG